MRTRVGWFAFGAVCALAALAGAYVADSVAVLDAVTRECDEEVHR